MGQIGAVGQGTGGPGIGSGARPRGVPEKVGFEKKKFNASGLRPGGTSVGTLDVEGPSDVGEVSLPVGADVDEAVQKLAEEMKKEPLPLEHRELIETFHELILRGGGEGAGEE